ncbi:MAG: hypothetical protein K6F53_12795 [Lachnospiraceae bacterium]|nr:hypothetical protein [Lachnospiraceae bacterium]
MFIRERIELEIAKLAEENSLILRNMSDMPDGILACRREGSRVKWFVRVKDSAGSSKFVYLSKKERAQAVRFAKKTYYQQCLQDNCQTLEALRKCLKHLPENGGKSVSMRNDPGFAELLRTKRLEEELAEWCQAPYEKNPLHTDHLIVRASNGELVRSKSEAFILSALFSEGIPFRYESRLILDDITLYPDFTIRRPRDGKTVIWEHFGLMSQPAYMLNAQSKIQKYIANGYYPMDNLITTFENDGSSLDFEHVMDLVEWLKK